MIIIDLYKKITNKIINKLEGGITPWRRPYSDNYYTLN